MDHHRPGSNRLYKTGERKFFTVNIFLYFLTKFKNGMTFGRTNTEAIFHNVPPPAAIIDLQKIWYSSGISLHSKTAIQLPCFDERLYCN